MLLLVLRNSLLAYAWKIAVESPVLSWEREGSRYAAGVAKSMPDLKHVF